jgi:putative ABC transport system substrate-binding protein
VAARARAQPTKLPTIGYLGGGTPATESLRIAAFSQQLRELGWIEGRNLAIEYRWPEGRIDRVGEIAAEFVQLKVDVIVTIGTPAALAAKRATSVIPIIFTTVADPIGAGLVVSLSKPAGNVTGLSRRPVGALEILGLPESRYQLSRFPVRSRRLDRRHVFQKQRNNRRRA